jgi:peptidoglycan/LPS O-acetylase OafA/YrhL
VYFLIWLAIAIPLRIGSTHDISYGVYIYAFPIQQTLAIVGWNRMGWFGYSLVSLALTLPLAWASWLLVERPVMSFKEWTPAWFARPRVDAWLASRKTAVVAVGFVGLLFAAQMVPVVLAAGKN